MMLGCLVGWSKVGLYSYPSKNQRHHRRAGYGTNTYIGRKKLSRNTKMFICIYFFYCRSMLVKCMKRKQSVEKEGVVQPLPLTMLTW